MSNAMEAILSVLLFFGLITLICQPAMRRLEECKEKNNQRYTADRQSP